MEQSGAGQDRVVQSAPDQGVQVGSQRDAVGGAVAVSVRVQNPDQGDIIQGLQDPGVVAAHASESDQAHAQRGDVHASRSPGRASIVTALATSWSCKKVRRGCTGRDRTCAAAASVRGRSTGLV